MKPPATQFANGPDGKVAFQVLGDSPVDLILSPPGGWNIDLMWENPLIERYFRRLASFARLILINFRGTGVSDPIPLGAPPTAEEWVMDWRWVMDEVSSDQAAFLAFGDAGAFVLPFAATFPERTRALVLVNCHATLRRRDDYPCGFPPDVLDRLDATLTAMWGTGGVLRLNAPDLATDENFREWYGRLERTSFSPSMFELARRMLKTLDVRGVLPSIQAPTLVVTHAGDAYIRPAHGRYLAEHIAGARYVERPGFWGLFFAHDVDWLLAEVQEFLTGTRGGPSLDERVLATVLFTDIVGSTERAAEMGDERWRALLDDHDAVTRRELERFRGRPVKSTGDGVLATFDGPARAIRCAHAIRDALRGIGVEVRTGLHTGEVEPRGEDIGGIAVHIGARVMAAAGAGEILVSGSIPPLVAGSGIEFTDRGAHSLKGVPGEWRLFKVMA